MTSQDTGGVRLSHGRSAASVCRRGCLGHCGGLRRRLDALHEGGVLLEEGWGHFGWVGPSCSKHDPWPVDPAPRGAGLLEARLKAEPESNHDHRAPAQTAGRGRWGRTCDGAPGRAARTPDSLLRGLVSTALTSTSLSPKNPAEIVGILRFLSGVQRRYACDVSTVDTHTPSCLAPQPPSPPGPLACPGFPPERVSQKS